MANGETSKETKKLLDDLAGKCSKKLGVTTEAVTKHFNDDLVKVKKQLPNLEPKLQEARAFVATQSFYKQELRSPSIFFEGVVLGASEPFDMVSRQREEAKRLFQEDPKKAVLEGYTDGNGNPLYNKPTWNDGSPNRNYGKTLPDTDNLQNIVGICREKPDQPFRWFTMQFNDALAGKVNIPMFNPVKFRANPKQTQPDPNEVLLNPYSHIEFEKVNAPGFDLMGTLRDVPGAGKVHSDLGKLPEWYAPRATLPIPKRMVLVEADVQHINNEPNQKTGNKMIVLSDATLPEDHEGVTAWLPEHLHKLIDFGSGSRVIALGTVQLSNFQDRENYLMNLWGIYADPKMKLSPDEGGPAVTRKATSVR
jgi:hypothetical protein